MRQLILDLLPETQPSLDNFVTGDNMATFDALINWKNPANKELLFFLWGEEGSGKTHLLKALNFAYYDAGTDPALKKIDPKEKHCAIDHIDSLNKRGQLALFNIFNRFKIEGGKLLIAARKSPQQLVIREDLRTRLGSGLIYRIHPLTDPEKKHVLLAESEKRTIPLSGEMVDYLLQRAPRDMRSLMALLEAIDRYSLEHKRIITQPLLREILHHFPFP